MSISQQRVHNKIRGIKKRIAKFGLSDTLKRKLDLALKLLPKTVYTSIEPMVGKIPVEKGTIGAKVDLQGRSFIQGVVAWRHYGPAIRVSDPNGVVSYEATYNPAKEFPKIFGHRPDGSPIIHW